MKAGDVVAWERTFTEEDVRLFARFSGDEGEHHLRPDEAGRLMVHGLLTATMPTKVGGDINFIARRLTFNFLRPVFTGDTVRCEVKIEELEERGQYTHLKSSWVCRNQHGREVMTGDAEGVIRI
ncbi:MAG TPA: MaoC family dehydratase [Pyrinomonadaceae bacterium]|jgi:acyl dehydratase|nr:MaoC family dehydratase [Pyrinomonadaceae bacterium]